MSNELRQMTRQFVQDAPFQRAIAAVEADPYLFPKEFWARCVEIGGLAMDIPEEYGGGLLDSVDQAAIMEELARGHAGLSLAVLVQNSLTAFPIRTYGNEEQKRKYLPQMATGELIASFGLSEPGRGSDAKGIELTATRDESAGVWKLNGTKRWITSADRAGLIVLATRTGTPEERGDGMTVFLVEVGPHVDGFSVPKPHDKIGQFGSTLCDVIFENVTVTDDAILGELGGGWNVINGTLEHSRIWIAAQASGIAMAALDEAEAYTAERIQFGRRLNQIPPVANHLAVLRHQVEIARFLVEKAARHEDEGDELAFVWASLAKLIASETCLWAASDAMLLHGGTGYVNDLPISRIFRDSGVVRIYEGAAHIQVRIIERYLDRDKIIALFPPSASFMRDASELTSVSDVIAEVESWQPGLLAVH
jgi:alkylation response protein AidB-like acyl-CoA dehydrogenase